MVACDKAAGTANVAQYGWLPFVDPVWQANEAIHAKRKKKIENRLDAAGWDARAYQGDTGG